MRSAHHPRVPGRRDGDRALHQDRGQDLPVRAGRIVGHTTRLFAPPRVALAALLALGTVALLSSLGAGQAARAHEDCPHFDLDDLFASVEDVDVIVVGELVTEAGAPAIAPEAYLKGPAIAEALPLSDRPTDCDRAVLPPEGSRVLAALRREGGGFQWPVPAALFVIEDGVASNSGDNPVSLSEDDLVKRIREVSGQYAVLATDESEGASIDWLRVVLPVTLAAIVILAIALVLLRIWHRIDPEG